MPFTERLLVKAASYVLSEKMAYLLARASLATQSEGLVGRRVAVFRRCQFPEAPARAAGTAVRIRRRCERRRIQCHRVSEQPAGPGSLLRAVGSPPSAAEAAPPRQHAGVSLFGLSNVTETRSLHKDCSVTGLASLISRGLSHLGIQLDIVESVPLKHLGETTHLLSKQYSRVSSLELALTLDHLVRWARLTGLSWLIEHDIFIAKSA